MNRGLAITLVEARNVTWTAEDAFDFASTDLIKAGELYSNFHNTDNPRGEVPGQITLMF